MKKIVPTGKNDTRSGFGVGLHEAGKDDSNVVALCADLKGSLKMDAFAKDFPERFIQCGISEANMVGMAAGLSMTGKVPFAGSFAGFVTGRVYDQVRQAVAYTNANVKLAGSHSGLTVGEDGATHQILEDIGMMKMLPNMVVLSPCDYNQTKAATLAAAKHVGPVYIRFGRPSMPIFTAEDQDFVIGKADVISEGSDVTIIATGHLVWRSIEAAQLLEEKGISVEVINMHTIKPLDSEAILASAKKTGAVVTCEEHFISGGLGDSVAHVLSRNLPTPIEMVGVDDTFGESGTPDELVVKYKIDTPDIVAAVERVLARK